MFHLMIAWKIPYLTKILGRVELKSHVTGTFPSNWQYSTHVGLNAKLTAMARKEERVIWDERTPRQFRNSSFPHFSSFSRVQIPLPSSRRGPQLFWNSRPNENDFFTSRSLSLPLPTAPPRQFTPCKVINADRAPKSVSTSNLKWSCHVHFPDYIT